MKYFAILVDRNGFTKEIEIDDPRPYIHVAIKNPITNRVAIDSLDYMYNNYRSSIEQKTFYQKHSILVSKDKKSCWMIYEEY